MKFVSNMQTAFDIHYHIINVHAVTSHYYFKTGYEKNSDMKTTIVTRRPCPNTRPALCVKQSN